MKFTFEICVGTLPSIRTERCKIDIKEQLLYRDLFLTEHLQSYLTRTLINQMFCYPHSAYPHSSGATKTARIPFSLV